MSEEIKLDPIPVSKALAELKSTVHTFDASFSKELDGENILDMADQLNELKQSFNEIAISYHALLLRNTETTNQAVESMKETDESLASVIQPI